jgi:hypothetical protein
MGGIVERRHDRVADDVVDERCAAGSGKAEPVDLQRRRPLREHGHQRSERRAFQVDEDVDAERTDAGRHLLEAQAAQLLEMLAARAHALAKRAAVVGAGRQQRDLERERSWHSSIWATSWLVACWWKSADR